MDKELIDYIIKHYSVLLPFRYNAAQKFLFATEKAENFKSPTLKEKILNDLGTTDKEVLQLLNNGYEEFELRSAEKILREHADKMFINRCSKCARLARTPLAKQCRHPIALGRKNYLFAGSHESAQRIAVIYSLLGTCKASGVDPLTMS
jgi:hypothetical protein